MKSKSKKQFPVWSQNWLLLCNNSSILWKKWVMTVLLSQVDLSGSVCHLYQCFKCCDCLLFVPLLESVYFTPVDLDMLNFKFTRQHFK